VRFFARGWRWLVGIVLVAALGLAGAWFVLRPVAVEVVVVQRSEVVQTVVASGRVLPSARVGLASLGLGRVVSAPVIEGAHVEAGALLAQLDDTEAQASVAGAEAAVLSARARLSEVRGPSALTAVESLHRSETNLADARADLARLERLVGSGGVTQQDLERARSQVALAESSRQAAAVAASATTAVQGRQAAADLARAEADASAARARLADRRITAPAAGTVVLRDVEEGDVVTAGQHLFDLAIDGPVTIRIDPDESSLAELAIGQHALVSPEAFPDQRFDARVSYLAPAVDPQRGTIEVRLEVPAPPVALRTDMTVSVDVEVARREDALVLPASAVRGVGTSAPWVLVVEGDRAVRRDVRLGAIGEDAIELTSGVSEGDRVVPSTATGVEAGARVRVTRGG
jgi:HlyD family secretion protein